jgi:hypothetical protein
VIKKVLHLNEDYGQLTVASLNIYTTNKNSQWLAQCTYHIWQSESDEERRVDWVSDCSVNVFLWHFPRDPVKRHEILSEYLSWDSKLTPLEYKQL